MARIKVKQILTDMLGEGFTEDEKMDVIQSWVCDSIVPACCDEGCEVEPDGCCEHDCPSVLIALGLC